MLQCCPSRWVSRSRLHQVTVVDQIAVAFVKAVRAVVRLEQGHLAALGQDGLVPLPAFPGPPGILIMAGKDTLQSNMPPFAQRQHNFCCPGVYSQCHASEKMLYAIPLDRSDNLSLQTEFQHDTP